MDSPNRLTGLLVRLLQQIQGTGRSFTIDINDVFVQAASFDGEFVLLEVTGDQFLRPDRTLAASDHANLTTLGFQAPDASSPNWWLVIEDDLDESLRSAAGAAITALIEVMDVDSGELDAALSDYRPSDCSSPQEPGHPANPAAAIEADPEAEEEGDDDGAQRSQDRQDAQKQAEIPALATGTGQGEALSVETTYGQVLLYPNGHASLNGKPWSERPVVEWMRTGDGRLSVRLAIPQKDYFPHLGFVADTPGNVSTLRRFLPGSEDLQTLFLRLAVAEHYALTCILTGTLYHDRLAEAAREIEREYGAVDAATGWELNPRLRAANAAVDAFFWIRSADTVREMRNDEKNTWLAIQQWVRNSPWDHDFDFEILPSPWRPFALTGPVAQVRRLRRAE